MVTLRQTPPRIQKRLQLQEFYCRNRLKNRQTLFETLVVFKQKLKPHKKITDDTKKAFVDSCANLIKKFT